MVNKDIFSSVYVKALLFIALIAGFALTANGLSNLSLQLSLSWADKNSLMKFVGFLFVVAIFISLLIRWLHWNAGLAVVLAATLLAMLAGALWPMLVTLWFAGASTVLGYWILAKLKIKNEDFLNCFLVGFGAYGTAVGLLAHYPVSYPGVYGAALSLPLILGWRVTFEKGKSFFNQVTKTNSSKFDVDYLDVAIGVVSLVYFVVALMPEVGFDSLVSHLFIPGHLALRHQWGFDVSTYVWAVMPMLGDWIFSIGYMLAGETATRLINVGFIFILGGLLRNMVLWAGGTAIGARWAVLIFLSTPLTFTEGSSLYIESIWASFTVAGALAVLNSCSTSGKPRFELPIAGLLLGYALAAKAVTFTILPVLLLLLIWRYKSWYKATGLQVLILGLSLFLITGAIPYVTAWWATGNPVFPMFNKIFQSPFYDVTENFNNQAYNTGFTWNVLYKVVFESGKYLEASAGASGFQWLLLFLPAVLVLALLKQYRSVALLLVAISTIVITFHSQSYLRYIFPSVVILMAAIGVASSVTLTTGVFMRCYWYATVVITIVLNLLFFNAGNGFYRDFPLKSIFDSSSREQYLLGRQPIRNAVELVNHLNNDQRPVAVFAEPLTAGLSSDALYPNWYNHIFLKEITSMQTVHDFTNSLLKRGVSFVILDSNWDGGVEKKDVIKKATESIAEYGSISVRKIKVNYRFGKELLSNPDFMSIKGWVLDPDARYDPVAGIILTNVNSPAYQAVAVSPGTRYLNTVNARCAEKSTLGRVQINWLDIKGEIIGTAIKTFECSPVWAEYTMEVTAPVAAINASVYVSGQSATPLEFKSNSLRQ